MGDSAAAHSRLAAPHPEPLTASRTFRSDTPLLSYALFKTDCLQLTAELSL